MNYKNIRSLLLVWIAAGVVSCHGDLDIMQDNKLSVSNMWKTSIQVENSTYGIYSAMRDNFVQDQVNVLTWGELRVRPALVIMRPVPRSSGKTVSCWSRQSIQKSARSARSVPEGFSRWLPSS